MAITTVYTYPLNGTARDFNIPFEYLARRFVSVTLIGTDRKELSITTDFRFTSKTSIQTTKAWSQADGYELIEIRRNTSVSDRLVDFADGSILRAYELNIAQVQTLHVAEEARNMVADTIGVDNNGMLDARARRIVNVADAIEPGDAVTLRQQAAWANSALNSRDAAKLSETNSKASENAAKLSETNSKASENAAKLSETNSKASENAAKLSETNSKASENAAKLSETNSKASENAAKLSETNSANSASEAAGYAAGVNLPSASGQALKMLRQKADGSGFEYVLGWNEHNFNPSEYLKATGTAVNSDKLQGYPASSFVRINAEQDSSGTKLRNGLLGGMGGLTGQPSALEIYNGGNNDASAVMAFHRGNSFAGYFGLDVDNKWKVGGWSMGGPFEIWHDSNGSWKVRAALRDASNGDIGTHAFLCNKGGGTIGFGGVVDGATLRFSDTSNAGGNQPSGSWKCLGECRVNYSSLFIRIS